MNALPGLIPRIAVALAMLIVLGIPFAVRPVPEPAPAAARRLVIITPHNEQIRTEFGRAFDAWHRKHYGGVPVVIDWRNPGGTSEIQKQLMAQYTAAVQTGRITADGALAPGAEPMPFDLFFGGGSFEHDRTRQGVRARPPGAEKDATVPMSVPMGFPQARLDEWYGQNQIGAGYLYDPADPRSGSPGQYWLGTALSGFGIVFNRDALHELGVADPDSWDDLTDPRLIGWVALADPRQSGSVATLYDSILSNYGWDKGWRTLRRLGANARAISNSSPKVPIDVSLGEAAMGVCIDFYGRYQAQAFTRPGETAETARVGYIDPPGQTSIDADPISLMRAGPDPDLARRFVEFTLTVEAQALWQFHAKSHLPEPPADGLGPEKFELRRMPVRRVMYEKYLPRMIDQTDPFKTASTVPPAGWRSAIGPMMGAFAIDTHDQLQEAWRAINEAADRGVPRATLDGMTALFDAWPEHPMPDGTHLPFTKDNFKAIRADWREAEKDGRMAEIRIGYTIFFRDNYRRIVDLARRPR